jgi:hypothetical protein
MRVGIDARETGFHRISERDIAFERRRGAARRANLLDSVANRVEIAIERENVRTVVCKGRCDRESDPRAGTGHDRGLSIEPKHARTVKQASAT